MQPEHFSLFEPASDLIELMQLSKGAGEMANGRRVWCHAIDFPDGEIAHFFYPHGSCAGECRFDAPVIVFRSGGSCIAGQTVDRRPFSELLLLPAGRRPRCTYLGGAHEFVLLCKERPRLGREVFRLPATLFEKVWQLILMLRHGRDLTSVAARLEQLLASAFHFASSSFSVIARETLARLEQDRPTNARCTAQIAAQVGVSEPYLCRQFRTAYRCSIGRYIRIRRSNMAAGLLWGSSLPIAEVAGLCGYSDQSHLTRELDSLLSQTPQAFRRLAPCIGNRRLHVDVQLLDAAFARSANGCSMDVRA